MDLSCGFQSYLPVGTSCNARRERLTSRFISLSKNSVTFIRILLLLGGAYARRVTHVCKTCGANFGGGFVFEQCWERKASSSAGRPLTLLNRHQQARMPALPVSACLWKL